MNKISTHTFCLFRDAMPKVTVKTNMNKTITQIMKQRHTKTTVSQMKSFEH